MVMEQILDNLDLFCAWRLGATCKYLHRIILEDDGYWKRRARQTIGIQLLEPSESGLLDTDCIVSCRKSRINSNALPLKDQALVHDPALNGHKELLKIYVLKPIFVAAAAGNAVMPTSPLEALTGSGASRNNGITDLFELLQSLSLWENFVSRDKTCSVSGPEGSVSHCKLGLFGPGIESARTKHLVHRIVQAHDSSLNAVDFVAGLPGGIGSGVRVKFEKGRVFDLVCLYTNSGRLREDREGVGRLLARHNRMLAHNVVDEEDHDVIDLDKKEWLHENVLKVLPTLDVLLFAIDVAAGTGNYKYIKRELDVMLSASSKDLPLIILCCFNTSDGRGNNADPVHRPDFDMVELSDALEMTRLNQRPWSIFEVDVKDMKGFVNALRWVFYRREKQMNRLKYHNGIANSSLAKLQERLKSLW